MLHERTEIESGDACSIAVRNLLMASREADDDNKLFFTLSLKKTRTKRSAHDNRAWDKRTHRSLLTEYCVLALTNQRHNRTNLDTDRTRLSVVMFSWIFPPNY